MRNLPMRIIAWSFTLLTAGVCIALLLVGDLTFNALYVGVIGSVFSFFAYMITLSIAINQDKQLNKIEKVGTDTQVLAEQARTETVIRTNTHDFFGLKGGATYYLFRSEQMLDDKVIVPFTPVSEDFVVQVIQGAMQLCYAEIQFKSIENLPSTPVLPHCITLRTEPLDVEPLKLPCRFNGSDEEKQIEKRTEWVHDWHVVGDVPSPKRANKEDERTDLGIIARLHFDDKRVIVLQGRTQVGTWVAGGYLNALLRKPREGGAMPDREPDYIRDLVIEGKYEKAFFGGLDFVAIVVGRIDTRKNEVKEVAIFESNFWVRNEEGRWVHPEEAPRKSPR